MKKVWKKLRSCQLNHAGSALLTVVLVVSFLTILATTLMYITGMNFQIKQADYRNKKNFYSGEVELEKIRAKLMEDASAAGAEAYKEVSMDFVSFETKDVRLLEYNRLFLDRLEKTDPAGKDGVWDVKLAAYGGDWLAFLTSYRTGGTLEMDPAYDLDGNGIFTSSEVLEYRPTEGIVRIKGLRMIYTDPYGLTTIISTDMEVYAPPISWEAEGTLKELPSGVTVTDAAKRNVADVSKCVHYTNWKKE